MDEGKWTETGKKNFRQLLLPKIKISKAKPFSMITLALIFVKSKV